MEEDIKKKKDFPTTTLLLIAGVVIVGVGAYLLGSSAAKSNTQTQAVDEAGAAAGQELDNCFFADGEMSPTDEDIANWQTFEGNGYSVKYPKKIVSIEEVEGETSRGDDSFHLSYFNGLYEADIYTQELARDTFRVDNQHYANIVYEAYSDTWWLDTYTRWHEWPEEGFEECNPNPRGITNDKKHHIYYKPGAEPLNFERFYYVVLDDLGQSDNHTPLIVTFRARGGEDDRGEDVLDKYKNVEEFVGVLENIIKTIETIPTSRG